MLMVRTALLVAATLWTTSLWAGPREDALAAYGKFFEYFKTGNHDQVVTVFSADALFIGTIAPEITTDPAAVRAYFVKALSPGRGEVRSRLFDTTATLINDEVVLVTANWQSERTLDGVMSTNGPSRNSSVMHRRDGRWYIVQFHNSWKPR